MTAKNIFKKNLDKSVIIIYDGKPMMDENDDDDFVITAQKNSENEKVIDIHEIWIDDTGHAITGEPISLPLESIEKLYKETVIKSLVF